MKLTKNTIGLYKGIVVIPSTSNNNRHLALTVQANLMFYGYLLSEDAMNSLSEADENFIVQFNDECLSYLNEMMGGNYDYQPLYKNFPHEVMSMSDCELFWNQILHYYSNGKWIPESIEKERVFQLEKINFNIVNIGHKLQEASEERFMQIFTDLCSINTSLTPIDKEIVEWFCREYDELIFPDKIPFKETLCLIITSLYNSGKELEFI